MNTPVRCPSPSGRTIATLSDSGTSRPSRDFRFVGTTICYAYMQAVGLVNDHLVSCFRHGEIGARA